MLKSLFTKIFSWLVFVDPADSIIIEAPETKKQKASKKPDAKLNAKTNARNAARRRLRAKKQLKKTKEEKSRN